jgi:hypothetical protein
MAAKFQLESPDAPAGDQPKAIEQILGGFAGGQSMPASEHLTQRRRRGEFRPAEHGQVLERARLTRGLNALPGYTVAVRQRR